MTPAEIIRPFLMEANRRRPELAVINTTDTAGQLLQLALALAGPDWAHVGKTGDKDGSHWAPAGFTPFDVNATRPDGQSERIRIVGVSQDAAWHVPTHRQVKVLAFSAANDPGPWEHGPAQLTPYDIDPVNYRWHNPPVPQFGSVASPIPQPTPVPPAPSKPLYPSYEDLGGDAGGIKITRLLEADYMRAGMRGLDGECGAWQQRVSYDFLTGKCKTVEEAIAKHREEWCQALGISVI